MDNQTDSKSNTSSPKATRPKRRSSRRLLAVIGIVALAGISGYGGAALHDGRSASGLPFSSEDGNSSVSSEEGEISNAASKVSGSVVSIVTSSGRSNNPLSAVSQGAGTGIVISSDGYVLTNKHVIDGARQIEVVTNNGKSYTDVKIVGSDPLNDVAFLKLSGAKDMTAATIGDSTTTRIGQSVVAIGNSLGQYQNTVTSGIISGKGRPIVAQSGENDYESLSDLIQTDAAINPGNSGGPLINNAGQVIGINTAVASDAQGIGFAIPISAAKGLIKTVLETGKVERAYVGVNYLPITPEVASQFKLDVTKGAYVHGDRSSAAVVKNSPAAKAGLKDGDVITKVNDKVVGEAGGVSSLIGQYAPGEKVKLEILRGGKTKTVEMTLKAYN